MKNPNTSSEVCNISCFEHEKVSLIKQELAKCELIIPLLAEPYKLLGNKTRLKILFALAKNELCVCDIAHVLSLSVAATSHQLKLLYSQGWLTMRSDGKMMYYQLENKEFIKKLNSDMNTLEENLIS